MVREPGAKGSLSRRVFLALVAACAVVAVVVTAAASLLYQSAFLEDERAQLAGECRTVASLLNLTDDDAGLLALLEFDDTRVTLIAPDGTVTYDGLADASTMENHSDRPEVVDAIATGSGSSDRPSETAGYVSLYEAVLLDDGEVVRLSVDRASVATFLMQDFVLRPCRCGGGGELARLAEALPALCAAHPGDRSRLG